METKDHVSALNAVEGALNERRIEPHKPGKDTEGFDCPTALVGRTFLHGRRGTLYKVAGWAWDGERDLWMVVFHNVNPQVSAIPYARKVANFTGKQNDGTMRFIEVHDVASISPPAATLPAASEREYGWGDGGAKSFAEFTDQYVKMQKAVNSTAEGELNNHNPSRETYGIPIAQPTRSGKTED